MILFKMNYFFSSKLIFAFLVITLSMIFLGNTILNYDGIFDKDANQPFDQKDKVSRKVFGAKIHQQNSKGEKFVIIAESLQESKTEKNKVVLENSLTRINQNGVFTDISAGLAIISNNYVNFDLSNEVKIIKKTRNFFLKTKTLVGTIDKGNFYTNDKVKIIAGNTKIYGNGLDLINNGEYIKIKGKAKLKMLLLSKNEN